MLVFIDIKTTGNDAEDKLCAISVLSGDEYFSDLVNEGRKVAPEASAVHHIGNVMLKDSPPFSKTKSYKFLQELNDEDIVVFHDYDYVFSIFQQYGLTMQAKIIDTKRITKHLISDIERFDLQYLRYELQLLENPELVYKPLEDVNVIKSLFEYLLQSVTQEKMFDLSFQNVLLEKFSFGKYSGRYIEEIVQNDPQYLHWMLSLENLDADLRYTIEYYLEG